MESLRFNELSPNVRLSDGVDLFCLSKNEELFAYFFTPEYKDRPQFQLGSESVGESLYELTIYDVWHCRRVNVERHRVGHIRLQRMPDWCVVVARVLKAT